MSIVIDRTLETLVLNHRNFFLVFSLKIQKVQTSENSDNKKAVIEAKTMRTDVPKMVMYSLLWVKRLAGGRATKRIMKNRKTIKVITPETTNSRAFLFPYTSVTMSVIRKDNGTIKKATETEKGPKGTIFPPKTFMPIIKPINKPNNIDKRSSFEICNMKEL